MPVFQSDGHALHYEDRGDGAPVILLHGFGMSALTCWEQTGWYALLNENGFRAIALDARGHGSSAKPIDPADYSADRMKTDVLRLMEHLNVDECCFAGHSMGGRTTLNLLAEHPRIARAAILISNGSNVFDPANTAALGEALESGTMVGLPAHVAGFVDMLLSMGNDPTALAAYCRNPRPGLDLEYLGRITVPVKVICGADDPVVGEPEKLRSAISGAQLEIVPGCEHTNVLSSAQLHRAALAWLTDRRS